ncbi:MAG: nicotinate-nicotinamide nucleotide adenylyltransferase, partial [Gammaproteobacteria bacterium]|nr:nicotinate-nicotinamide nucleotide adenylyltransferase [Gammaproteobacteria bacterium]
MAVLGGTFDPVHHGHLRLAVEIIEYFSLDSVRMIPAAAPNLRGAPEASAEDRLAMAAAASGNGIEVDDREVRRAGRSYTVDTLAGLRAEHGDAPLLLVLGADAATRLNYWDRWQQLFDYAHLV